MDYIIIPLYKSDPILFNEVESSLKDELSASWWITYREKSLTEVIPYIVVGGEKKAIAKPKVAKGSSPNDSTGSTLAPKVSLFSGLDDVHRFVGELRDRATGELVVDADCPF
jgi:hypothetical protein